MKNLVMLHLESVSKLIFQMNSDTFPALNKLKNECMRFSNYYGTATSTAMVLNDITYGDLYRTENTELFGNFVETHPDAESFVDELSAAGYYTLGVHYPSALGNEINPGHMYAKQSDLVNYPSYEQAISDVKTTIQKAVNADAPFLIYFCNEVSHLCYDDQKKFHIKNPTERWHYGYQQIDATVSDIFEYLRGEQLLENTVIVLYGDHGDDFYCHDYNGGYAHSIEPYANIVHTPFMIYDKSIGSGDIDDIICSLDIKQIVYNLVGYSTKAGNPYIYNRYHSKRKYVFSRNLFAAQQPKKINGFICNVRKAYGITTEQYSLILTDEGWRMYIHQMDPTCNNNVLDFFYLKHGELRHIGEIGDMYVHYKSYMGHGTTGEIQRSFRQLKKYMSKEIMTMSRETGLSAILNKGCTEKIFYRKNMVMEFAKIEMQIAKKKAVQQLKNIRGK